MMFWHHLLLYNWNCTERGALWTTMKIHKNHQKILFKHKKIQFRLSEIWHETSVIASSFYFLIFTILSLSIPQVHFLFDQFLHIFLILPIPCVKTILFLFFLLCVTLSLPLPFIIFLPSFLLSLLPSLTAPGAQLWPLVTLHHIHKCLTVMQGREVTLGSPQLSLGAQNTHIPISPYHFSPWGKLSRCWTRWPWSHLPAWTTHVEETLLTFPLDLEHSSNLLNECQAAIRAREQPEPKLVLRPLVNWFQCCSLGLLSLWGDYLYWEGWFKTFCPLQSRSNTTGNISCLRGLALSC